MIQTVPCWHRAAWRLLGKAAEMVQPARFMSTEAELQALVDELCAYPAVEHGRNTGEKGESVGGTFLALVRLSMRVYGRVGDGATK